MAKDPTSTSGPSPRKPETRKPVTLDLSAEPVPKPGTAGEPGKPSAAEPPVEKRAESAAPPPGTATDRPKDKPAEPPSAKPERTDPITPSAFATSGGTPPPGSAEAPAATAAAAGRGASFGSLLLAALLGGGLAAGGLYAANRSGVLPLNGGPDVAVLETELGAMRSQVAALREAGAAAPTGNAAVEPLRQQIGALEASIAELRNQPAAGGDAGPAAEEVRSRLDAVEQSLAQARQAGGGPELAQLETRLSDLAGEVEQLRGSAGAGEAVQPVLNDVARRIEDVAGRVGTLEERPVPDTAPLQSAVDELRAGMEDVRNRLDSAAAKEEVAALRPELQRANERADQALRLAPALAADALASAVERGRPFAAELAALRSLGVDDPALAEIEPQAQNGLPGVPALAAEFDRLSGNIETRTPIPPSTGAIDRILQSARGLVEVRPAGQVEGSEPAAVLARIKDALNRGDLQGAINEWEALPDDAKAATASWAEKARARLAAEALAARLRTDALSRIGTQS